MSEARQPNPRRAPDAALMAGLALLAAVMVVVIAMISSRLPSLRLRVAPPARPAATLKNSSLPAAVRQRDAVAASGPRSMNPSESKRKRSGPLPIVRIVERRATVRTSPTKEPAPERAPVAPAAFSNALAVERKVRAAPWPHPLTDVVEPPRPIDEPVSEPDVPPEPVVRPEASYPEDAAREDVTGSVRLKVIVDRRGRVEDTIVVRSSGDDRLDAAADDAVRQSRYRPARRKGRAATGVDYVVIDFYRDDRDRSGD